MSEFLIEFLCRFEIGNLANCDYSDKINPNMFLEIEIFNRDKN